MVISLILVIKTRLHVACDKVMNGSILRLKEHIIGTRGNVAKRTKVMFAIINKMMSYLEKKKRKKPAIIEELSLFPNRDGNHDKHDPDADGTIVTSH